MGSAVRELYIKTALYIPAPASHKHGTLGTYLPTHAWNNSPKLGVTVSPAVQSLLGPRIGSKWSSASRPL